MSTEKKLIQEILESALPLEEKMKILEAAGVPLGAEYDFVVRVTTKEIGSEFLDKISATLSKDEDIVSFSFSGIKERVIGDDRWDPVVYIEPDDLSTVGIPDGRMYASTGQLSSRYVSKPQYYTFHITDDGSYTKCGNMIKHNWKTYPYSTNYDIHNGKKVKHCEHCKSLR